ARQCETERLGKKVAGAGGQHAGASPAGRTAILLETGQALHSAHTAWERAYASGYAGKSDGIAFLAPAGLHRSAADDYSRNIHTQRAHHHAWRYLVAVRDTDHPIEPVSGYNSLERISDNLAAGQ